MKTNMRLFTISIVLCCCLWGCQNNFDKRLEKEAKDFTANNCPQEVEEGTTLDSLTYDKLKRVYSLHFSVNSRNEQVLREKGSIMHQLLLNELRNNVDYKEVKDQRITFKYVYRSQNAHTIVYTTNITATEYSGR